VSDIPIHSDIPIPGGAATRGVAARPSLPRLITALNLGTTLEFFDFALFGAVSALVFPKLFFPTLSPFLGLLASFLTFGIGYVIRRWAPCTSPIWPTGPDADGSWSSPWP
jgi:hypothetical protein